MTDSENLKTGGRAEGEAEDMNVLMVRRREELTELRKAGVNPYPAEFDRKDLSKEILASFSDDAPPRTVCLAGRIMTIRRMGKASFCHLQDSQGRIQIYLKKDDLGAMYDAFKLMDIGDIIGVTGFIFRTKMGEVSVHAQSVTLLAKSMRPLPVAKEKTDEQGNKVVFDPFSDKELRYRQRYVDLIVNPDVRAVFIKRARIIRTIRQFLDELNYLEVETPILQPVYGGASARPFITHHNALDIELFLRIADELYLKRLIVGGYDGVYEISKDFRNEGMDRFHNPEFTMMELYVAYQDYYFMMGLVEDLVGSIAEALFGERRIVHQGREIDLRSPWKRLRLFDAIYEYTGQDLYGKTLQELKTVAMDLGLKVEPFWGEGKIIDEVFSEKVEPHLIQPTFITDYPVELSPLAKRHRDDPKLVERFEPFIVGGEIGNSFSELNDPIDQRERFLAQQQLLEKGDDEAQMLDEDFLRALEYGMPPTAGLGIGIDRLVMLFTDQPSIRDVLFFPQMKPEKK